MKQHTMQDYIRLLESLVVFWTDEAEIVGQDEGVEVYDEVVTSITDLQAIIKTMCEEYANGQYITDAAISNFYRRFIKESVSCMDFMFVPRYIAHLKDCIKEMECQISILEAMRKIPEKY